MKRFVLFFRLPCPGFFGGSGCLTQIGTVIVEVVKNGRNFKRLVLILASVWNLRSIWVLDFWYKVIWALKHATLTH